MVTGIGRLDYASFLVECDEQEFQVMWLPEWNELVANRMGEADRKRYQRVHALGAVKGGRRRYVFSLAGSFAELARQLPFAKWADQLTRLDYRNTIYECAPDTYEKLCVALEHAETRNNIETFKVAARTKTHQRDTGGRGVRYGSRKSDISTKLYRRGKEHPAIETQIQDDRLDRMVLSVLELSLECDERFNSWFVLSTQASVLQQKHVNNWLSQSGIDCDIDGLKHEHIPMPKAIKDMYNLELWAGDPEGVRAIEASAEANEPSDWPLV